MVFSFISKKRWRRTMFLLLLLISPAPLQAMHIAEGFLPLPWCIFWYVAIIPFLFIGLKQLKKKVSANPRVKMLAGVAGGLTFLLSALKLPSVTGSCSHLTGVGLGSILFGPFVMTVIGMIVLLFQALLMAHGGITTLGANTFSMAVAGPVVAYSVFRLCTRLGWGQGVSVFLAAFLSDLSTYAITSVQLALAFPSNGSFLPSLIKFLVMFMYTQLPLAIIEGIITVGVFNFIYKNNLEGLRELSVIKKWEVPCEEKR
jgi:cobalt/nickel transport system permease protein